MKDYITLSGIGVKIFSWSAVGLKIQFMKFLATKTLFCTWEVVVGKKTKKNILKNFILVM
jgi:hypothetical protein